MENTPDTRWGAHGWTTHEFHIMILDVLERKTWEDVKIRCDDCGRVYLIAPTHHAVGTRNCPRCYERHC